MKPWTPKKFFTEAEVEAARTVKGGFSEKSLAKLGVPWPPPKGWRAAITRRPPQVYVERPIGILDDPRKRRPSDWIRLNPRFAFCFTKRELQLDRSPLR